MKRVLTRKVISIKKLCDTRFSEILCYPRCEQEEFKKRLIELENLGVQNLEFVGDKNIFDIQVLGKGCVGIVLVAHTRSGKAALKIRRVDADRKAMFHEGKMLKRANRIGVGPKFFEETENFLLMELINGDHFPKWFESLKENVKLRSRSVIIDILEQCYRLDQSGLDHGELSNAPKHIIIDATDVPYLIDFETASIDRRVSNVTSICQYLFLGSQIAKKVNEKLGKINENKLIGVLRKYKQKRTRKNFEKILENIS